MKTRSLHIEMNGHELILSPVGVGGWSFGHLYIWKANWTNHNPWHAVWTDLFGVRHTLERATLSALKLAIKNGSLR